ncbi:crotonase/enoyl-CoA hydratase family protein [SAR92 clade bacterium H921]|nr:crotonase/enoyl-CoA hydratase family protein [SAR92 clade bacterium H921]
MNYKTIEYLVDDGILTLRLNRPDKMNAFTLDMSDELTHAFYRASDDDDVRVIIVTGAGKAFCAGMDLSVAGNVFGLDETRKPTLAEMAEPDNMPGVRDSGGKVTLAIYDCKKPVIGAINGAAVGIGATMICAMDIRLASERARIGFVFGKIGIAPEGCSTWFLPRIVGMQQSLKWMMTGEIFDAAEAYSGGLVYEVCAADELMSRAYEMARQIADNTAPVSSALIRQMMYRNSAAAHPVEAHKIESLAVFYASKVDGKEGVSAFLEKRPANFESKSSSDMPPFYPWW